MGTGRLTVERPFVSFTYTLQSGSQGFDVDQIRRLLDAAKHPLLISMPLDVENMSLKGVPRIGKSDRMFLVYGWTNEFLGGGFIVRFFRKVNTTIGHSITYLYGNLTNEEERLVCPSLRNIEAFPLVRGFDDLDDGKALMYMRNGTMSYFLRSREFFETEPWVDRNASRIIGHFLTSNRTESVLEFDNETEFLSSFQYMHIQKRPADSCLYAFLPYSLFRQVSAMKHLPYQMPIAFDYQIDWDGPFSKSCCENVGHLSERPTSRITS
jgi:hypothetical protein